MLMSAFFQKLQNTSVKLTNPIVHQCLYEKTVIKIATNIVAKL